MGVTPSNHKEIYTGQEKISGSGHFIPHEEKNVLIYVTGDLAEYVLVDGQKLVGEENAMRKHVTTSFAFKYEITIPKNLTPGQKGTYIRCEQYFTPEERV